MRILVVEDERDLCDAIAEGLLLDGYVVDKTHDGIQACELLDTEPYDLVLLDLNLPGKDGLEVLKHLRDHRRQVKVLILSARDQVSDKVLGLQRGANDYLVKPFAFAELEARIRNLLHRQFTQEDLVLSCQELTLNTVTRSARFSGEEIPLTRKELALLEYLLMHRGRVISQEELMEHVWDRQANQFSNAVRVHIASLRKKLRCAMGKELIKTKVGEGYYIE